VRTTTKCAVGSVVLLALACAGCDGSLTTGDRPPRDAAGGTLDASRALDATTPRDDSGRPIDPVDASEADAPTPIDPVDAYVARPDTGPVEPGSCPHSPPLAEPIAGCMPPILPSTGDPHEDCVIRINQFRCECQHLQPLIRWVEGEACADMMSQYDSEHAGTPHAAFYARICDGGSAQNECPGWPSIPATIGGCLQQMWDEGPGDFYGPPPHGHYINMSTHTYVACGFYEGPSGVYAAQNFR
jgi:hypothetical protein